MKFKDELVDLYDIFLLNYIQKSGQPCSINEQFFNPLKMSQFYYIAIKQDFEKNGIKIVKKL